MEDPERVGIMSTSLDPYATPLVECSDMRQGATSLVLVLDPDIV